MNPTRVYAENYRTFERLDLDLPEGVSAVVGPNGSGKSSAVNLIDLAVFGTRSLHPFLSTDGSERMEVGCEFEHAGELYRVRRGYSAAGRGKATLDFEIAENGAANMNDFIPTPNESGQANGQAAASGFSTSSEGGKHEVWLPLTRESASETQALIEETIGLSRATFRASSFLGQGDAAAFTEASPRDRKAILAELLNLDIWESLLERVRVDKRSAEAKVEQSRGRIEMAERELALRETLEEERKRTAGDAAAAQESVRRAEDECREAQIALDAARERRAGYQAEAERLADARRRLNEIRVEWEDRILRARSNNERVTRERAEAGRAFDDVRRQVTHVEQIIAQVKTRLEAIKTDAAPRCPTCEQELGDKRERAIAVIEEEIASRDGERRKLVARGEELDAKITALDVEIVEAQAEHSATHATAQTKVAEAERAVTDAEAKAGELEAAELDFKQAEATQRERESALRSERDLLQRFAVDVAKLDEQLGRLDKLAEQVKQAKTEIADTERELTLVAALEKAFGRDGIPALIVENAAIPHIESEANRILGELGTDFRVELRTQRALKASDGLRDTLDIVICTSEGEREYETYSGGERSRINVALRIALARLLANRRGADSKVLVLDELEFLDDAGQDALANVLRGLQDTFSRILVVSHAPVLRESFDQVIEVAKGENGRSVIVGGNVVSPVEPEAVPA